MPPNKPYRQINIHGIAAQIFAAYRISENFTSTRLRRGRCTATSGFIFACKGNDKKWL